jgi:electron transfer flavoprotein-quinone oxidoreductase
MRLDDLSRTGGEAAQIAEDFLHHPLIAPLVKGGKLLEYGAHLVPEGGLEMMPRLGMPGMLVVGDAAGLTINNALTVRGMDLAIGSGMAAAEAVLAARDKGSFSAGMVNDYARRLEDSFVMKDMRTYARTPGFLETERLYTTYPAFVVDLMTRIFASTGAPKEHMLASARQSMKASKLSLLSLAADGLKGVRAL